MIRRKIAKKENILVVDDERVVGIVVKEELEDAGYTVEVTVSPKNAIQKVQRRFYALAFVDLWMPEMDGVETCRQIKKHSPETQVVLISGRPDGFGGREGEFVKAGGLDFFLYKPFKEGALLAVAKKVLAKKPKGLLG